MNDPLRPPRKKRNSSKVNLTFSVIFHSAIVLVIFFFAAREGILGKKLKQLTVTMVPKEKQPPKEKPPEPKVEPAKTETAKTDVPQPKTDTASPPPPSDSAPAVAPAMATLPSFNFSDGAHQVDSISDANGIYKALVEHSMRARWNRPQDLDDSSFIAEAELSIDRSGEVTGYRWVRGSGNARWDKSVKSVLDDTKTISRPPPKTFPKNVLVRFDVESVRSEAVDQFSAR